MEVGQIEKLGPLLQAEPCPQALIDHPKPVVRARKTATHVIASGDARPFRLFLEGNMGYEYEMTGVYRKEAFDFEQDEQIKLLKGLCAAWGFQFELDDSEL